MSRSPRPLAHFPLLTLPPVPPIGPTVGNWQTSAGMRRAPPFQQLAEADAKDGHDE
jgi:hypothetical protein